jgi:hypothetical protein
MTSEENLIFLLDLSSENFNQMLLHIKDIVKSMYDNINISIITFCVNINIIVPLTKIDLQSKYEILDKIELITNSNEKYTESSFIEGITCCINEVSLEIVSTCLNNILILSSSHNINEMLTTINLEDILPNSKYFSITII